MKFFEVIFGEKIYFILSFFIKLFLIYKGFKIGKNFYIKNFPDLKLKAEQNNVIIGNNVSILGKIDIRTREKGYLKIGDNVDIAGGSGVIKDISDNSKVMGYPAKSLREFLKENR